MSIPTELQLFTLPAWVTIERATSYPCWEAVRVEYIGVDDERNNQGTNIYVKALDMQGRYLHGARVIQAWADGDASMFTRPEGELDFNGEPFGVAFPMSGDSSFSPDRNEIGPYRVMAEGASDVVAGLGLPLKRHVQYLITFQLVDKPSDPPDDPDDDDDNDPNLPLVGTIWRLKKANAKRIVFVPAE